MPFTRAYIVAALEHAAVAGIAAFAAQLAATNGATLHDLGIAGIAAAIAAGYALAKTFGGNQALKAQQKQARKPNNFVK